MTILTSSASPTLKRTYILVGVVGVVMLAFILYSNINASLLNKLTSPLWSAVREIKLESTAVQHEVTDLLRGEIDPNSLAVWLYLDQSIWHLSNLLRTHQKDRRSWLLRPKRNFDDQVNALKRQLVVLKTFFRDYQQKGESFGTTETAIAHCNRLFAEFNRQLDQIEEDVSRVMASEQLRQNISHVVVMGFGVMMIAMLLYQMHRYDRYRKSSHQTLTAANRQLSRQIEERLRTEAALKESERLFRTIFNTCPDGILLSRLVDNAVVDVNPGFTELTGYTKDEVVGEAGGGWFLLEGANLGKAYRAAVQAGHSVNNVEFKIPMKDGRERTVLISANTVDIGQEPHLVAVSRDISDLKVAENELRLSYELMKIANENRNTQKMLRQFVDAIQFHAGCNQCTIRLIDDNNRIYDATPLESLRATCRLDDCRCQSGQCLCACVIKHDIDRERSCFTGFGSYFKGGAGCDPAGREPAGCSHTIRCARFEYGSLALVPIRVGHQTLGLLQIADDREGMLTPAVVNFMEAATLHMGTAIRRLRAEEGLENAYKKLEKRVQDRTRELSKTNHELQTEIEERRQIEYRLRKNRNTLQTVIDGIEDSLILLDRDMKIRMLNRAAAKTYRIDSIDKVLGKFCFAEIGPHADCEACEIIHAVKRGTATSFERTLGENDQRLERIAVYPVKQADDEPGGTIIRISDITDEKRFEKQLIQSEKMASLGILVSSIGHEINNPNNFISFNIPILREYLEMLIRISDQYAATQTDFELFHMSYAEFREDVFKLVDNIEHGSSRISSFVSNLRDFSQGDGTREKVWLDLSDVLEKVLSICKSQIKKRIRDFQVHIPDDHPKIHADEYCLEQILLNLIVNAIQAADKADSAVSLSVASGESWHEATIITVADNGCGIAEENLGNIFNPFYTTKPAGEGTGLGLYVCHNLVQRLGGRMEVKSKEGKGSTFSIFLPDKERRRTSRG